MPNTRTGEDYLDKGKKKKKKTLWDTMKNDIMKNKSKKKRLSDLEKAMKDAGM
tara:strand:- start:565 stop:723 length:159 start_codon:yes stop_codon:yes gene_type:complete